jgi:Holliday junction DNA helicase RuvA
MFAYIKGSLEMKLNDAVIIEAYGVGYKIYMAQNAINKLRQFRRCCKSTYTLPRKRR